MSAFSVMLHQCELQAEKLCSIEINEEYIKEVDIFNNYFNQLKQVIESEEKQVNYKDKVINLLNLLNNFINRIQLEQASITAKINNINKNKNMVGYGDNGKRQFSHRINRRY